MTNLVISSQEELLSETNPASIDELFNRDPLLLSELDLDKMAAYYRGKRENWIVDEKAGKTKAAPRAKAAPKAIASLEDIKNLSF